MEAKNPDFCKDKYAPGSSITLRHFHWNVLEGYLGFIDFETRNARIDEAGVHVRFERRAIAKPGQAIHVKEKTWQPTGMTSLRYNLNVVNFADVGKTYMYCTCEPHHAQELFEQMRGIAANVLRERMEQLQMTYTSIVNTKLPEHATPDHEGETRAANDGGKPSRMQMR